MSTLAALVVVASSIISQAEAKSPQPHQKLMQYLEGEWTYEWPDFGEKGTANWRLVAGGHATLARFVEEDGDRSIELGGWRPDEKKLVAIGHVTDGGYWHIEFTEVDENGAKGTNKGVLPDGRSYDGTYALKRIDQDHFEGHLNAVVEGKKVTMVGKFTRKTE
jgi:hypothetical protein